MVDNDSCGWCNSGLSIYLQRVFVFWWGVLTSSQSHGQHQSSVNECAAPPAPALAAPSRVAGDGPLSSPWCHPSHCTTGTTVGTCAAISVCGYCSIHVYCQLVYQIHIIQFKRNNQCSVRVRFVSPLFVGPHASQEKVKQEWGSSPFASITAVLSKLKHIAIENLWHQ